MGAAALAFVGVVLTWSPMDGDTVRANLLDEPDALVLGGEVFIDGTSLNDELLANGLARKYGISTPWC